MARATSLRLPDMPPTFGHPEAHYRSAALPAIVVLPPTPPSSLRGSPTPSFRSIDMGSPVETNLQGPGGDQNLYQTILSLTSVTSLLSLACQKAAAQYRAYALLTDRLENDHVEVVRPNDALPLHNISQATEPQPRTLQSESEAASITPSTEQRLVEWIGSDVRDVLGPTLYSVANGSSGQQERHVPFAGVSRNSTTQTLQNMYIAFRTEVSAILAN